jgi:signal transduction histidine kinase
LNKLKTDLLAVTSHDLRSPLNGILGVADVMGSDPTLSAENKEYVGLITQSGEQLLAQIGDLLDLAKAEAQQEPGTALPTAPVNLLGTLDTFLATFRKQATKKSIRVELANSFADSAPTIAIPASELSRIVNNLLSNALKFTPQGGDISVTVRHAKPSGVEIVIADTGIGIPPEKIPLLFNRYSKTSRPGTDGEASTGLGLSIVKDLITRNDGRIEVTSVEGKGTTFTVFFPIRN